MQTTELNLLQNIVWPTAEVGAPQTLYFRAWPNGAWRIRPDSGAVWHGENNAGTLSFSTFFGAFSLSTWCREAGIGDVTLEIECEGNALLNIWYDNGYEPRQQVWSGDIGGGEDGTARVIHVALDSLQGKGGILYPEFEPTGSHFALRGLRYMTPQPPRQHVRLALIMPTFKRENYVRRSMALIESRLIRIASPGSIELLVIDNGQTLGTEAPKGVRIIPNKNYGGAGGFARGVIEALQDTRQFTHALFCDDDIAVEPEAFGRLYNLLHYVDEQKIIAGGMLNMQNKGVLHEVGARVKGLRFWSAKGGADLTKTEAVIRYDQPEYATFYGWWFTCYPLARLRERLLPVPFFVGFDDVEMGLRLTNDAQTITLAGIAVWHDEFHKKEMNWRWYYHARNGLAANYMYVNSNAACSDVFRQILGALLTYRYERAANLLDGVADVLKGPDFLKSIVPDEFHATKAKAQKQVMRPVSASQYVSEKFSPDMRSSRWRKLLILLTLNGHLLPSFLMRHAENAFDPGWAIEYLHSMRLQPIFRKPVVLYYEPTTRQGMLCTMDRGRFFSLLIRAGMLYLKTKLRTHHTRSQWKASGESLTSLQFWREYLGL